MIAGLPEAFLVLGAFTIIRRLLSRPQSRRPKTTTSQKDSHLG